MEILFFNNYLKKKINKFIAHIYLKSIKFYFIFINILMIN